MKKLTQRELEEVLFVLNSELPKRKDNDVLAQRIATAIDQAEGMPESSGDKYLDAKAEVIQCLKKANGAIKKAWDIGLTLELGFDANYAIGENPNCPKVALTKLYKEF